MRYLKIGSIIFEIDLCEDSENLELDNQFINHEYALYQTNKFKILNFKHIADNEITEDEFNRCMIYLYINNAKIDDDINNNLINNIKQYYNINKINDFINKEITRKIYYFKSYERAFNFRFILDKQYELFKNGYSGIYRNWLHSGILATEFYHINGKIDGPCKTGNEITHYVNGESSDGMILEHLIILDHFNFDYE
jgi:hypothetical protein